METPELEARLAAGSIFLFGPWKKYDDGKRSPPRDTLAVPIATEKEAKFIARQLRTLEIETDLYAALGSHTAHLVAKEHHAAKIRSLATDEVLRMEWELGTLKERTVAFTRVPNEEMLSRPLFNAARTLALAPERSEIDADAELSATVYCIKTTAIIAIEEALLIKLKNDSCSRPAAPQSKRHFSLRNLLGPRQP